MRSNAKNYEFFAYPPIAPLTMMSVLIFITALLGIVTESNTLILPNENKPIPAIPIEQIDIEQIDVAGEKRYRILTGRYDITAPNAEDAKCAGERLEHLFCVWNRLFNLYANTPAPDPAAHRHRVVIYRDKPEYIRSLRRIEPLIDKTNGFYHAPGKTAYFYSIDAKVLFHEGTHQIFWEHFYRGGTPDFPNNFWVVEGIAAFMETFRIEEQSYKVGSILADKLLAAKIYQFERDYTMPICRLTEMSMQDIQSSVSPIRTYCQSAAIVHWLMFAEEGRHRKALFELLRRTYLGTATPKTLSELTGLSFEDLDKRYLSFLQTIPD